MNKTVLFDIAQTTLFKLGYHYCTKHEFLSGDDTNTVFIFLKQHTSINKKSEWDKSYNNHALFFRKF